jgi:hypothetical protein
MAIAAFTLARLTEAGVVSVASPTGFASLVDRGKTIAA